MWLIAMCCAVQAQTTRTITVRVLDGKTGKPIVPSNLLVRIDKQVLIHSDWVRQDDDATGMVTLPATAKLVSVEAAYDESMEIFVNCDTAPLEYPGERHWYSTSTILQSGLVVTDGCVKPKNAEDVKATAKPGELILFVRERRHGDPAED